MILDQFVSIESLGLLAELNIGLLIMELLLFMSSIFLMLLILVQRGKGGGLTGALGGMGGQSAFGSKAARPSFVSFDTDLDGTLSETEFTSRLSDDFDRHTPIDSFHHRALTIGQLSRRFGRHGMLLDYT